MTALQGMYYLISCCILGLNLIRLWTKLGLWFDYVNDRICTQLFHIASSVSQTCDEYLIRN